MRSDQLFNDDWKFFWGDREDGLYAEPAYDDTAWEPVTLPHDWDTAFAPEESAASGAGGGYARGGVGWYRRHFTLRSAQLRRGRRVTLLFEGVYMDAAVYVNGVLTERQGYGYSSFSADCTDAVRPGDNLVAVRVDNSRQPNSRWYSGSGIYRDVRLIVTEAVHFTQDLVHVDTNGLFPGAGGRTDATLQLSAFVENEYPDGDPVHAQITWTIRDRRGRRAAAAGAGVAVPAGEYAEAMARPVIEAPHLWSAEDPYLYTLTATLSAEGQTVDEMTVRFGIRTAVFDKDRGFLLNGDRVKIRGVCLHHDSGLFGAAFHREVWRERLMLLKDMGANGIRCSHNPPAPGFLDLCDELGFLVMDEAFDEWALGKNKNDNYYSEQLSWGFGQYYYRDAEDELIRVVHRDYNHPSVILWSVGNEIPEQSSADGVRMVQNLTELCHREDCTRMVTSACDNIAAPAAFATLDAFAEALDVVGYNYAGRWRERAERFYEDDRISFPGRCFIGSENPSAGGDRGDYSTGDAHNRNYLTATMAHEALWRFTSSRDYIAGDYVWTGIDYLGEARWPLRGAGCGPIDTAGFVKDTWHYFRSIWNEREITLHLLPHWNWPGEEGTFKQVICYTSCERVRLYLNGRLIGEKGRAACPRYGATKSWDDEFHRYHPTTNDLHLTWDVPYEPGILRAEGFIGEKRVGVREIATTGRPVRLAASTRRLGMFTAVTVTALDADGREVPDAAPSVSVRCGPGIRLVGMDAGDLSDLTAWSSPKRRMHAGKLLAVFCAGNHPDLSGKRDPGKKEAATGSVIAAFSARGLEGCAVR